MNQQTALESIVVRFWSVLAWVIAHPYETVGIIAIVLAVSFLIASVVFAIWQAHEERKQDEQRKRLEAAIGLTQILDREAGRIPLPPPLGARPPRPKRSTTAPKAPGYPSKRVG